MSSAELQSLMSQLQAQRHDPYLHTIGAPDSLTYDTNVGQNFWYPDGSYGMRPNSIVNGLTLPDVPPGKMTLSQYDPNVSMDYTKKVPFKKWEHDPINNPDGSINYDGCTMQDMALMIGWEKLLKYNMKHDYNQERKKVVKFEKQNRDHNNGNAVHVDTAKALTMASALVGEIAKLGTHKHNEPAHTHSGGAHAPEKKKKVMKKNPDVPKQLKEWEKSQTSREKSFQKHGKEYTRPEFKPRTPGTYGPQEKDAPY